MRLVWCLQVNKAPPHIGYLLVYSTYLLVVRDRRYTALLLSRWDPRRYNDGYVVKPSSQRVQWQAERLALVALLGGKCSCDGTDCWHDGECGVKDKRCLQLDHIAGGGSTDVQAKGGNRRMVNYYLHKPDKAVRTLQLLCANCNWVKRHNNNEVRVRKDRE